MEQRQYSQLQETLYYERMDNGLDVYVLPKPGFQKTYATFSTKYGSIDNHFQVAGQNAIQVPDGIAHFLEHKMFEEPEGDIFATFAQQGASANAFTTFDRTVYLFSSTAKVEESLETLIDFVQRPYFTDENVEKEKGIIAQEINMYRDNPAWRSYFGLIEAMYQIHPVHIDIAGTVESIGTITKETLYTCYHTFYHPTNMLLFVVGGVNEQAIFDLVRRNQSRKEFEPQGSIDRIFESEPEAVQEARRVSKLPVSIPRCLFGCKEPRPGLKGRALLEYEIATRVMMDLLLGSSSQLNQTLYEEGLTTDSFGSEFNCSPDYAFSIMGGETKDPDRLVQRVQELVEQAKQKGFAAASFERIRNKAIGSYLRMLNSPEAIANEFTKFKFRDTDLFDIISVYEALTLEQVHQRLQDHFDWNRLAVSIVEQP
ncbi:EF-P 5-aminopentanol modification-associated protein YfmH [Paenibacillus apiarius]|uniref:Insulinase family protein n=1 Tax=Paenibacillus apiarius TaxID=46240 RepID=A0ABT4DM50_9BACL|nr:pitrilysin family protein [Paenibacillus apiarius]MCY9516109.1 insulinase family protein [Paenibacillus apiarius]MCY9518432.1 insulinase family protein [Paenibacillus apiarius]MCY9551167.1 insulinase family protein [Paenibacillus apiarius]MCY9558321.1 insulinase family protein [Paenibacillus apiarius]MCY9684721.1 insulinase family protein [Paenibacillus apiarius]